MAIDNQFSFSGGEIAESLMARQDLAKHETSARLIKNAIVDVHGGIMNRPGTKFLLEAYDSAVPTRLIPFAFNTEQTYALEFSETIMRVIKDGGYVLEPDKTITGLTQANPAVVTVTAHGYANGDWVYISGVVGMTEVNGSYYKVANQTTHTFELTDLDGNNVDSTAFTAYSSGGTAAKVFTLTTPYAAADMALVKYTQSADEMVLVHPSYAPQKLSRTGHAAWTIGSYSRTNDPFTGANLYPSTVTYYEQRRIYARQNNARQKFFLTKSAAYDDHSIASPVVDDDAITYTIAANQVNEIRHLVPIRRLMALTSGGEWLVQGADGYIVATQPLEVQQQSTRGASDVRPITIGDTILFVQATGKKMRDLNYSFESDSYGGNDLTLLAPHLFKDSTIRDIAFAEQPHSIVWTVMEDGSLRSMTYLREHQIWAWMRHESDGEFESVCTIREGDEDAVYFVVRREVNGTIKRYVERLQSREYTDVRDAFFVDSGLSLDNPVTITGATQADPVVITAASHGFSDGDEVDIYDVDGVYDYLGTQTSGMTELNGNRYTVANSTTNTFELNDSSGNNIDGSAFKAYKTGGTVRKAVSEVSGLDHLEGKTVSILYDGYVHPQKTVTNGAITLNNKGSRIHVGLPYLTEIETIGVDFGQPGATTGRKKQIPKLTLHLEETMNLKVGPRKGAELNELKLRQDPNPNNPIVPFTGEMQVHSDTQWTFQGRVYLQNDKPVPMKVLAISPEVQVAG